MSGKEFARFANDLIRAANGLDLKGKAATKEVGGNALKTAQALAPRDTGKLRAAISLTQDGDRAIVETSLYYAAFQEYGTSRMAPNPYMGPAFERHAPELVREVEKIADDVAKELS